MRKYIWESACDIHVVINSLMTLTDQPDFIDRIFYDYKSFDYKHSGLDEYKFSLNFHYSFNRASYQPPSITGIISKTTSGCKIEAHQQRWFTVVDTFILLSLVALLYATAIAAPFIGFSMWIVVSTMYALIGTGILLRFLYTRKHWISENVLLDIIDHAANVKHKQIS